MALISGFLLAFVLFLLFLYFYWFYIAKPANFPPGPPRLPIWGSYWWLLKENYYFVHKSSQILAKRYKTKVLGLYIGSNPAVFVCGNELCKETLTRDEFNGRVDNFVNRTRTFEELFGLFFVDGAHWKEQRRFSLRNIRDYGFGRRFTNVEELIDKEVRDLIEMFTSEPKPEDHDICKKKGQVLLPDLFYPFTANAILYMLIGKMFDKPVLRGYSRLVMDFAKSNDALGGALSITPWLRFIAPDFFGYTSTVVPSTILRDFFKQQIEERKLTFSDDHHADFTDVYLSKLEKLKSENITDTTFSETQLLWILADYYFPAAVAVGQSLTYLWAYFLNNPELQTKIQDEIDSVVGRSRLPSLDDRKNMPYTEATIREIIRKDPVIPISIPRRCTEDTLLGGYFIPKDTIVVPNIWDANNDPKAWGDPENFRPERFLDAEGNLLKKDLSMGFGAGKRLCVGETFSRHAMFQLVSGLLQNFTFQPIGDVPDLTTKMSGLVVSTGPIWVEAVAR